MSIKPLRRTLGYLETALMALAGFMLMVMLATMTADAVGRYLFNKPLAGNFEFISFFAMVMLAFLALPKTYVMGGHVKLEILEPFLHKAPFRLSERLNALIALVAFGIIAVYAGAEAIEKIEARETTIGLVQLPIYISFVSFPIGCAVLCLRLALEVIAPQAHIHKVEDEL